MDNQKLVIEEFDELPKRNGGGGGRSSEVMNAIRSLQVKKRVVIPVDLADDFDSAVKSRAASVSVAKLPFKARVRPNAVNRTIEVYRCEGDDYTTTVNPKSKTGRCFTVNELAKRNANLAANK